MPWDALASYLLVVVVVLGVNLLPALGPPTWAVLVWFRLEQGLSVPLLVVLGAFSAAAGRYVLAWATGLLRHRVSQDKRENLDAARQVLQGSKGRSGAAIGLFLLSPVPSAQLFEAAGLIGARLLPLVLAFGAGRLVTYALYVGGASAAEDTDLGRLVRDNLTSPIGVGIQLLLLLGVYALTKVDWRRFVR